MWEVFERLCKEKGVTPYRVGEETGIKSSTFYGWKTGKYTPKQEKLQKIADYFGVSLEYLMTGEEEGYYVNPETAEMAQKIFENRDLRLLFDAAEDASPEDLQLVHQMLLALKSKERG